MHLNYNKYVAMLFLLGIPGNDFMSCKLFLRKMIKQNSFRQKQIFNWYTEALLVKVHSAYCQCFCCS